MRRIAISEGLKLVFIILLFLIFAFVVLMITYKSIGLHKKAKGVFDFVISLLKNE